MRHYLDLFRTCMLISILLSPTVAFGALTNFPRGHGDGTNCPAGQSALGVDSEGNAQGCADVATQAELDTHVTDTSTHGTTGDVVGTTDTQTLTNKTIDAGDSGAGTTRPSGGNIVRMRSHDTDCTSLTDGKLNELCQDEDDNRIWVCEPTAGDCDTPAEWKAIATDGNAATATALGANGSNCGAGQWASGVDASGGAEGCTADDDTPDNDSEVPNDITVQSSADITTDGKLQLADKDTAANASCIDIDSDRTYGDLDCDGIKDGGEEYLDQAPTGGSNHNLLSSTHPDTTAAAVQRGDLIVGQQATPKWERLALGASGEFLRSDGTDAGWAAIADADVPDTITVSNYLPLAGGTMTGTVIFDDGAGDSPKVTFTPQTGTSWDIWVEDTGDDLQIQVNTASTEEIDISNSGAGTVNLNVDGIVSAGEVQAPKINTVIVVDGDKYALTNAGINSAIGDLPASGGKVVAIDGSYDFTNQLIISKNNVVLECVSWEADFLVNASSPLSRAILITGDDVKVLGCQVDGNKANQATTNAAIKVEGDRAVLKNLYVHDSTTACIWFDEVNGGEIVDSYLKDCGEGSTLWNAGVYVASSQNLQVIRNFIDTPKVSGVNVVDGGGAEITPVDFAIDYNWIYAVQTNQGSSVHINDGQYYSVSHNHMWGNVDAANGVNGIFIANTETATLPNYANIESNIMRDISGVGIELNKGSDNTVVSNKIFLAGTGTDSHGMFINTGNSQFIGNLIDGAGHSAAFQDGMRIADDTSNINIIGNTIKNNNDAGVKFNPDDAGETIDNVKLAYNWIGDDQGTPTQEKGLWKVGSGSVTNIQEFGNTYSGNTTEDTDGLPSSTIDTRSHIALHPYETSAGNTGEIQFLELLANGSNYKGIKAPDAITSTDVCTIEDDSTFLDSCITLGSVVDGTEIAIGGDAQGEMLFYDGADYVNLSVGTDGQQLETNGASANPSWEWPSRIIEARKNSVGTVEKGCPVYVTDYNVAGWFDVETADADTAASMPSVGIAREDLTNAATGTVLISGQLLNLDTSSFSVGDELYVDTDGDSTTTFPGCVTTTAPTTEANSIQKMAEVVRSNVSNGSIIVYGAGRANAAPNLDDGATFIGNTSNQATAVTAFTTGGSPTLTHEYGGLEADVSAYGAGLYGQTAGFATIDVDTEAELETAAVGGANIILSTEIDSAGELAAITDYETGSGALVFATSPTLSTPTLDGNTVIANASSGNTRGANDEIIQLRRHATDCTAITDGKDGEFCWEQDSNTVYVCEPSAGDCDTAGEWTALTAGATNAIRDRTSGMFCGGTLSTDMDCEEGLTYIPSACTVQRVELAVTTAPTGAAIIVDVNECTAPGSCTTIDSGTKPQIAASSTTGSDTSFTDTSLAAGNYLGFDIDQVGSTVAGSDLTVTVVCRF